MTFKKGTLVRLADKSIQKYHQIEGDTVCEVETPNYKVVYGKPTMRVKIVEHSHSFYVNHIVHVYQTDFKKVNKNVLADIKEGL